MKTRAFCFLPQQRGYLGSGISIDQQVCSGTGADAADEHFTGKERDTESGLDYFGARYYGSTMARFMSPDWAAQVVPVPYAKLSDPQTLNLYEYLGNNPLKGIDPDGHASLTWGNQLYAINEAFQEQQKQQHAQEIAESSQTSQASPSTVGESFQLPQIQGRAGQVILNSGLPLDIISERGKTVTLPLYGKDGLVIGTEVVTDNTNAKGTGTIVVVATNQDLPGSPTLTIKVRLKQGVASEVSAVTSDGRTNINQTISRNPSGSQITYTTTDYVKNKMNITVVDVGAGTGPKTVSDKMFNITWIK